MYHCELLMQKLSFFFSGEETGMCAIPNCLDFDKRCGKFLLTLDLTPEEYTHFQEKNIGDIINLDFKRESGIF